MRYYTQKFKGNIGQAAWFGDDFEVTPELAKKLLEKRMRAMSEEAFSEEKLEEIWKTINDRKAAISVGDWNLKVKAGTTPKRVYAQEEASERLAQEEII